MMRLLSFLAPPVLGPVIAWAIHWAAVFAWRARKGDALAAGIPSLLFQWAAVTAGTSLPFLLTLPVSLGLEAAVFGAARSSVKPLHAWIAGLLTPVVAAGALRIVMPDGTLIPLLASAAAAALLLRAALPRKPRSPAAPVVV